MAAAALILSLGAGAHAFAADVAPKAVVAPPSVAAQPPNGPPHTESAFSPQGADSCLGCHGDASVTGLFRTKHARPNDPNGPFGHGGLQCEACHGPAAQHIAAPAKGYGKVGEETCRSCHTDERTPDFDYAAAWAKIMH